jgi:hypothetical protein
VLVFGAVMTAWAAVRMRAWGRAPLPAHAAADAVK